MRHDVIQRELEVGSNGGRTREETRHVADKIKQTRFLFWTTQLFPVKPLGINDRFVRIRVPGSQSEQLFSLHKGVESLF